MSDQGFPRASAEARRQKALEALDALNVDRAADLDRIAAAAHRHFRVTLAMIKVLRGELSMVVGRHGPPVAHARGGEVLCRYAADSDDVFVIEDLEKYDRFEPIAPYADGQRLRFYAGAPLLLGAETRLGAFCILDVAPRKLTLEGRVALKRFAERAVGELATAIG